MPECYIRGNTIKYLRVPDEVIDKVQEETIKSRSDRRPPGVGQGSGRGREDGNSGRPAKGIGRGQDDGVPKGMGGGRGRCGGNKVEDKVVVQKLATERGANLPFLKAFCSLSNVCRDRMLDVRAFTLVHQVAFWSVGKWSGKESLVPVWIDFFK